MLDYNMERIRLFFVCKTLGINSIAIQRTDGTLFLLSTCKSTSTNCICKSWIKLVFFVSQHGLHGWYCLFQTGMMCGKTNPNRNVIETGALGIGTIYFCRAHHPWRCGGARFVLCFPCVCCFIQNVPVESSGIFNIAANENNNRNSTLRRARALKHGKNIYFPSFVLFHLFSLLISRSFCWFLQGRTSWTWFTMESLETPLVTQL